VGRFPVVQASNLDKREFELPRDLEGRLNVLLIAFQRWHQAEVDSWLPMVRQLVQQYGETVNYYELPTIFEANRLFRWWLDGVMRAAIPDADARHRTITLYLDKATFRQELGLQDETHIHVLVVDQGGQIWWQGQGAYTNEAGTALEAALASRFEALSEDDA